MSFTDLKPVRFDYHEPYQPSQPQPPYYNPYNETHGYQPPPPIHHNGNGIHHNGNGVQHHNGNGMHHNGNIVHPQHHQHPHHHVSHPHHQHPYRPAPSPHSHHQAPPPPLIQHLHYMVDSQDSDSQDSIDSTFRPQVQAGSMRFATKGVKPEPQYNSDEESLSEEVQNHWMPMTWVERSSDDPQQFNFVCLWGQCVHPTSSKQEFEEHLFNHIPSVEETIQNKLYPDETVQCMVRGCGKQLQSIFELNRHVSMHVFQADCQQKGSEALIEKDDYVGIESCGFDPYTNIEYEGMVLTCQWMDCGSQFNTLTDMFDHVGAHVDEVDRDMDRVEQDFPNGDRKIVYQCKWTGCKQVAESKSHLRRHTRHHSGEKALACPFCARFFSRRDKLYDHCVRRTILMTDPDIEDPYVCKLCQKRFGTERALCLHVTRHLMSSTCPLCSLSLGSRAEIHRHLMMRHSRRSKDFKCGTCSKLFFTESEMNRHAIYHTDVMYSCKHCPEKFKWKKQLLKHMKEHDENYNPTPYTCHICERAYTTGFALGRHLARQHKLQIPHGFSRFTYKKCADGLMRLQTKKLFRSDAGPDGGGGDQDSVASGAATPY
ncbi:unnamed protein product [Caenorhabditis brenneri]